VNTIRNKIVHNNGVADAEASWTFSDELTVTTEDGRPIRGKIVALPQLTLWLVNQYADWADRFLERPTPNEMALVALLPLATFSKARPNSFLSFVTPAFFAASLKRLYCSAGVSSGSLRLGMLTVVDDYVAKRLAAVRAIPERDIHTLSIVVGQAFHSRPVQRGVYFAT
jgi:hypothetical protein